MLGRLTRNPAARSVGSRKRSGRTVAWLSADPSQVRSCLPKRYAEILTSASQRAATFGNGLVADVVSSCACRQCSVAREMGGRSWISILQKLHQAVATFPHAPEAKVLAITSARLSCEKSLSHTEYKGTCGVLVAGPVPPIWESEASQKIGPGLAFIGIRHKGHAGSPPRAGAQHINIC